MSNFWLPLKLSRFIKIVYWLNFHYRVMQSCRCCLRIANNRLLSRNLTKSMINSLLEPKTSKINLLQFKSFHFIPICISYPHIYEPFWPLRHAYLAYFDKQKMEINDFYLYLLKIPHRTHDLNKNVLKNKFLNIWI